MDSVNYKPPLLLFNKHLQTAYPSLFRRIDASFYDRERITTPDNDFLDLDWIRRGASKVAVISHGLEGNAHRSYVLGMARALSDAGWDVLAMNFRSCSGEINRQLRMYHSGTIDDLHLVVKHTAENYMYKKIALVGFSMGGNQTLVYLGQNQFSIPDTITKAVVFSVPVDLKSSADRLAGWSNKIYMKRFLKYLRKKIIAKSIMFPGQVSADNFNRVKNFYDFDNRYTAPIHGFENALDYWAKCSSKSFIRNIKIPALIINALNDPFLAPECYPYKESDANKNVTLETPKAGGHVGFVSGYRDCLYWSEARALAFLNA